MGSGRCLNLLGGKGCQAGTACHGKRGEKDTNKGNLSFLFSALRTENKTRDALNCYTDTPARGTTPTTTRTHTPADTVVVNMA